MLLLLTPRGDLVTPAVDDVIRYVQETVVAAAMASESFVTAAATLERVSAASGGSEAVV